MLLTENLDCILTLVTLHVMKILGFKIVLCSELIQCLFFEQLKCLSAFETL